MTFQIFCATWIALVFGVAVAFRGYRFFLVLLPILGFVIGFTLGAQTLQAIFDVGFLTTVTSWVVGFLVGLLFGVLSYLFYFVGVALLSFGLGYAIGDHCRSLRSITPISTRCSSHTTTGITSISARSAN